VIVGQSAAEGFPYNAHSPRGISRALRVNSTLGSIVPMARTPTAAQLSLWAEECPAENPGYVSSQLITYIGNKRSLVSHIEAAVSRVKDRLGKSRLRCMDVFSGSGVISRLMKRHASTLIANDLEDYAAVVSRCYLANKGDVDEKHLGEIVADLNDRVDGADLPPGFIEEMYAPRNEKRITASDRVFYTRSNARRIDNYRRMIDETPVELRDLLLGPLLSEASVHANTAGVFKGFYKDKTTKVGRFGGSGADALLRILGPIELAVPGLSDHACECIVMQDDANAAVRSIKDLDLAYIDPPYNQHPYGSNYFMLNLIVHYRRPAEVSEVSGIPTDWRRSGYNVKARSAELLQDLFRHTDAQFLLVSFSNEGFVGPAEMRSLLEAEGRVEVIEVPYNAFRGSRSFKNRPIHVTEQLFLVER
jgi:adenine-specific DNA-methyltransferase